MKYKQLGATEEKISVIGLGTTGSGTAADSNVQKAENRIRIYKTGIELGINLFDTSELYGGGYAEELLGKAIHGARDKIIIASKFNPDNSSFSGVMKAVEGSLLRLKTDYLDLYQVHWPNPFVPLSETIAALEDLVRQGKIRHLGVGNFSLDEIREAQSFCRHEVLATIEEEYNLMCRDIEKDIIPYCTEKSITVLAYSPLNRGTLSWNPEQRELLETLARKHDAGPAQIIMNWVVGHVPVVALTKTDNLDHLRTAVHAIDLRLDEDDIKKINATFRSKLCMIPTDQISLQPSENRPIYHTVEEAMHNKYKWLPSPEMLSRNLLFKGTFKPIRLVARRSTADNNNSAIHMDRYDLIGEMKKFWAWRIAYGDDRPIPAYVREVEA
jgi:aryl-alcohol dehydrogenase-like predicted oxidoreductase